MMQNTATVKVRRCGWALGAEITGVDASRPLDPQAVAQIRQAMRDHVVVYLPGQDLDPAQLRAFGAQFGELDVSENTRLLPRHPDFPEVLMRANKPLEVKQGVTFAKSGAASHWHADYSYSRRGATWSFLLGKTLPSIGGDTMFTNLYLAYESLSPAFQRMIAPLKGVNDYLAALGRTKTLSAEEIADGIRQHPAVVHPLARVHAETGRTALFVNTFIKKIAGMTEKESKPLLDFLRSHAVRYEFIYRHRWTVNDLVIWDNRCSLHYAVQDYPAEMRLMVRCSLIDDQVADLYDEGSPRSS